jgi:hypothetical protein
MRELIEKMENFNIDFKKLERVKKAWVSIKDKVKKTADLDTEIFHFLKDLKASNAGGDSTRKLDMAHRKFRDASEDLVDAMHDIMKALNIE